MTATVIDRATGQQYTSIADTWTNKCESVVCRLPSVCGESTAWLGLPPYKLLQRKLSCI